MSDKILAVDGQPLTYNGKFISVPSDSEDSAALISYDNTNSGLLANSVQEAIDEIVSTTRKRFDAVITNVWLGTEAPYMQEITVDGILESHNPTVDLTPSDVYVTAQLQLADWGKIYKILTAENKIIVYATDLTIVELPIQLQVVK